MCREQVRTPFVHFAVFVFITETFICNSKSSLCSAPLNFQPQCDCVLQPNGTSAASLKHRQQHSVTVRYRYTVRARTQAATAETVGTASRVGKSQSDKNSLIPRTTPRAANQIVQRHRHRHGRRRHFGDRKADGNSGLDFRGRSRDRRSGLGTAGFRHAGKTGRGFAEYRPGRNTNRRKEDQYVDSRLEREIVRIVDSAEIFAEDGREKAHLLERPSDGAGGLPSAWGDDRTISDGEIFSDVYGREILSDGNNVVDDRVEGDRASSSEPPANEYECAFSGSSGDVLTVKHKLGQGVDESDDEDSGDDWDRGTEGSGTVEESPREELASRKQHELFNASSARFALLSGSDGDDTGDGEGRTRVATVVLPFVVPAGATMSSLHVTLTREGGLIEWDHTVGSEAWRQALCSLVWRPACRGPAAAAGSAVFGMLVPAVP